MGRAIAAVLAGYVVMAVLVMLSLSVAFTLVGPERAYHEASTRVTPLWLGINLPVSFLAAVVGGYCAKRVARRERPPKVLAAVVLVLGLAMAVAHFYVDDPSGQQALVGVDSVEELGTFEAASEAIQPTWYNFVIPLVGAAGVLYGARLRRV